SFYTFQSMSYTIDVYRGQLRPTGNVLHFFAYLSMFPQLVAGPIVRASHLLPQLESVRRTTETERWEGLRLVVGGYFKKVVIADSLAPVVNAAFGSSELVPAGSYWWVVTAMFACQIYCDFSGYSDIARGLARWMGYDFPLNFNHPYIATGFRDFWSRWHISLSTWFRDYVYIPLGGSRRGPAAAHGNMWVTMLVSGLWHGAAWTFVVWGVLHAAFLSLERWTRWPERLGRIAGGHVLALVLTLAGVLVAWVFFRAESLGQALSIAGLMFDPRTFSAEAIRQHLHWRELLLVAIVAVRHAAFFPHLPRVTWPNVVPARVWQPVAVATLVWACVFLRGPGSAFIYFQF
ncbi:MAG: MBOAT family protein, partial [Phycisphaerae bacterium]|nr:MBOAT family protein [Phycisphaerae bacterium]